MANTPVAFKEYLKYFRKRSNIHDYHTQTRHVNDFDVTNDKTIKVSHHSFRACGPILWNSLPTKIKKYKSVNPFRNQYKPA